MLRWLGKLYARRTVNVNVNIVVAGLLALVPTVLVVHLVTDTGLTARIGGAVGVAEEWIINAVTLVCDGFFDVAIYFLLHWLANHWPRGLLHLGPKKSDRTHLTFFRDATLVQIERMALSPLLYLIALAIQHVLIRKGEGAAWATLIGFASAIAITRAMHTGWMLRSRARDRASRLGQRHATRRDRAAARRLQRDAEAGIGVKPK